MAKYTTEVRTILENYAGLDESAGYNSINEVISKGRDKFFDFEFPIFDPAYLPALESKILKHFYTREIGAETVGRFKLFLESKLLDIMPYYNQLYESQLLEFNPFYDVDVTTTSNKQDDSKTDVTGTNREDVVSQDITNANGSKNNDDTHARQIAGNDNRSIDERTASVADSTGQSTNTVSGTKTTSSTDLYSDTPQGAITGLSAGDHLTNARLISGTETENTTTTNSASTHGTDAGERHTTDNLARTESDNLTDTLRETTLDHKQADGTRTRTGTDTNNTVFNNVTEYLEHVGGKRGGASYSSMLKEYRDTFLNIDRDIIRELEPLFMGIW